MAVTTTKTNKPINPRGNDQSPKGYNRAALYSGKALDFDGVNDEVNCGDINVAFSEISFAFHFNADSFSNNCIFQKESVFRFIGVNTNQMDIVLATTGNSWYSKKMTLTNLESKDYFLVTTYNGSELKAYLNGVLVDTLGGYNGSVASVSQNVYIGRTNAGLYYNGKVSGTKIFNTALTAAQVADLYNNPEKIVPTGVEDTALKLWLPMMEGAGTTAYDGSGNGNHGTISGATWTHGVGSPVAQSAVIDWNKGTNYQTYSEDFSTAWALYGVSISTDQTTAPDGLNTADLYDDGTGTGTHLVEKTCANLSSAVGISGFLYAKYIDTQYLVLGTYDTGYHFAVFDIQNGTLGSKMGGVTSSIEAAGNGFYKCSFTYSANTRINPYISFSLRDDDTANYFSGTGTNRQAYIWGASMRPTTDGDAYVKTDATAQTSPVLLPQGLTSGRDITGVNLFENVRKQGALNLDGNSWAEVHDNASLDITDAISVEAWVYWDANESSKGILGKWDPSANQCYLLYVATSSRIQFYISSTGANAQNNEHTIPTDGWVHIVGTDDGTNQKLYVNGVEEATRASLGSIFESSLPLEIGRYDANIVRQYANDIAQPRIYNRALTAEEVERNYNAGKNIYK